MEKCQEDFEVVSKNLKEEIRVFEEVWVKDIKESTRTYFQKLIDAENQASVGLSGWRETPNHNFVGSWRKKRALGRLMFTLRSETCVCLIQEPTEPSKQPIKTRYLGHVTGYQPIRDQHFLVWSV